MRFLFLIAVLLLQSCLFSNKIDKNVDCSFDINTFKTNIKDTFDADSVIFFTVKLQEEIYFPELNAVVIKIYNPTTRVLDFKKLIGSNIRFSDSEKIESLLKDEGMPFANKVIGGCKLDKYNDVIIEFLKLGPDGRTPYYQFICHYEDMMDTR
ncbi:hypothetical protein [Sphingobacterium sp. LRF_L2]|uniref:hypothetical protein n=1 Tax=Sphingobacterium sp. LRF_L2 TaxID=3369421 RepID=UPI003F5F2CAA